MLENFALEQFSLRDAGGRLFYLKYNELQTELGEGRWVSLLEALGEEESRVKELGVHAREICPLIEELDEVYGKTGNSTHDYRKRVRRRAGRVRSEPDPVKKIRMLSTYFTAGRNHSKLLNKLTRYMLAGSDGDYTAHMISLFTFSIDLLCRLMSNKKRKTGRPAAFHSIEAARGAAKNGQHPVTIIATLLHDLVEERVDYWVNDRMAELHLGQAGKMTPEDRVRFLEEYLGEYNDHAAGTYYAIGLELVSHVSLFPRPDRYYQILNSAMQALANLSRTPDTTYYAYLKRLLYPKYGRVDSIRRSGLLRVLSEVILDPVPLLDLYLEKVDGFYLTGSGEFFSREEIKKNAFREILSKILDRLNNTRDMEVYEGFSVAQRLYGAGFKNIYFIQAVEDKLSRPGLPFVERRLIEAKFLNKPKIAALYQILKDILELEREWLGRQTLETLRVEMERYKDTGGFTRLTASRGAFDGIIELFNNITLGHKELLADLDNDKGLQAECLVAFKSILEWMIAMPSLIRQEMNEKGLNDPNESQYFRYRIRGLGPRLEEKGRGPKGLARRGIRIKSFKRKVIP
ncbi:MAG: hypothetical protein GXP49_12540 [Deltaproteobacteria bacterium]|nr:hypothetical protein [Deltaproteobacteria bacterium]